MFYSLTLPPSPLTKRKVYEGHFFFADCGRYEVSERASNKSWINLIRDPVDQFVSHFHYLRSRKRFEKTKPPPEVRILKENQINCHCHIWTQGSGC